MDSSSDSPDISWRSPSKHIGILILIAVVVLVPLAMTSALGIRSFLGMTVLLLLFVQVFHTPALGLCTTFIFLSVFGGLRRILIPYLGWSRYDLLH